MRLLYIVPKIKNAGGVARVLAIKANCFVEHFGYEVHILSQNEDKEIPFYDFDSEVVFHNMILKGNVFKFFNSFQKEINQKISEIKPDVILVADNGLKAFVFPFIAKTKTPIVFECHGSKFIEEEFQKTNFISKSIQKAKYQFKDFGARKFTKIVALSEGNLKEWNVANGVVIPNPSWIKTKKYADLKQKKVIAIARNSYEKGLDRLLLIWKEIGEKYPDWTLDIYTDDVDALEQDAIKLEIESGINYLHFVKNIQKKYLKASICVMTSRTEGFPMVLLEAMASGLPCISYDCPTGPLAIITNAENGFLIPDNNIEMFVEKLSFLIENEEVRAKFGLDAKETSKEYSVKKIMEQWREFLESL
ncbi:glycosyltransferase family 4 protein [Flavobacterium saccharophilum]|uniref:Glycosyltransferase involved in cell wall bisynthesis n=1 Tax=Flavobacterium saccharophilum TaxID=29534 RepID=A0A1M7M3H9_9FLAO|nr:glycosyltransferase family 4 protein [Flavobacterium saccharophilum]SHM85135.1 Glycosyltransferase involved in cell wall bisynthesis [Flavobacterium saccharophilum]